MRKILAGAGYAGFEMTVTRRLYGLPARATIPDLPAPEAQGWEPDASRARLTTYAGMGWAVTARDQTSPQRTRRTATGNSKTGCSSDATARMDFGTADMEGSGIWAAAAMAAVGFLTGEAGNRLGATCSTVLR